MALQLLKLATITSWMLLQDTALIKIKIKQDYFLRGSPVFYGKNFLATYDSGNV